MNLNFKKLREIRKSSFSKKIPLNKKLLEMTCDSPLHRNLRNPSSQNIFLYLCDYIKEFSEFWFERKIENLKILDWGCGVGQVTFLLRQLNANVISCDVINGSGILPFANDSIIVNAGIKIFPLEHSFILPFKDEEFDIVLSFGVLEHVPEDLESLKEINRILKPDGLFFCLNLPAILGWVHYLSYLRGNYYHNRLYGEKSVRRLLSESNFKLIDMWRRQLFPKNSVKYPKYHFFEFLDQILVGYTFLKHFATNLEFVATKQCL
jgi:SAM-dependent methyltransferase